MKMPSAASFPKMSSLPKGAQATAQSRASPSGPGWLGSKDQQATALKASGKDKIDAYDLAMQAVSLILGVVHAESVKAPITLVGSGIQAAMDTADGVEGRSKKAADELTSDRRNPFFDAHAVEIGQSNPVTQRYLSSRHWKSIGGSAVQPFGTLSSLIPHMVGVNVTGAAYHGHAVGLTSLHMARIGYIAARYRDQTEVQDFCRLVEAAKAAKLSIRTAQLVSSVIPLASLPVMVATAALKAGIKLTSTGACYAAAAAIHWKAYEEQGYFAEADGIEAFTLPPIRPLPPMTMTPSQTSLSAQRASFTQKPAALQPLPPLPRKTILETPGGAAAGPASGIVWEIFTKRGATRAFGPYDIQALVKEPAGWMALADKLLLI
ncbi:hypothetical protein HN018_22140 (plasmid) [Lichenicola cladoniae]|uniref:Uncharacterized protein n=1 Tax=Lichenicola cladoniae TaxID=1484109 RepID=A0A6M8HXJ7_9PROT|nr:hypothetical protein [Lichenicola cladoniae]NPD69847.1 hypothetical protein [Acetobacteraceae bacterium]QKE92927.1 hypothetical protein HN018_22140 [Lichenicola cladoniae]